MKLMENTVQSWHRGFAFPSLTTPEQWRLIQSRISDVFGESEALSLRLSLAGAGRWAVANPVDKASEEDLLTR
jgi:hypothetical protein